MKNKGRKGASPHPAYPNQQKAAVILILGLLALTACARSPMEELDLSPSPAAYYVAPNGLDTNPGTEEKPWASLAHAAEIATAGQTVVVHAGTYVLDQRIFVANTGAENNWITFRAYPGEKVVLDASQIDIGDPQTYPHDRGTFQIEGVSYIRVISLEIQNSHQAGFMVRDSHHIELYNNRTKATFAPGIAVWETDPVGERTHHIKILGNTITQANTWAMLPRGYRQEGEPPHEAISIAGAKYFEVAYNYLFNSDKEGIDIKEVSKHGEVHHNFIEGMDRQGLYIDAWFGAIEDIEIHDNVVRKCRMSGLILSVENGKSVSDIRVHHNLFYDNLGTGLFFSRWGDGPRSNIQIINNTIVGNGYGPGSPYYWMTGGLYLFSNNLSDIDIRNNIVAYNQAFQIGYSDHWLQIDEDIHQAFSQKEIVIDYNLVYDKNAVRYPLYLGWPPDMYADVWAYEGEHAVTSEPRFIDRAQGLFWIVPASPAVDAGDARPEFNDPDGSRSDIGTFWLGTSQDAWWLHDFPPQIVPDPLP